MIRAWDLGRPVGAWPPRANDNRRRRERPVMPLASLVLAAEPGDTVDLGSGGDPRADRKPAGSADRADLPLALAAGWLAPPIAIWSAGIGAACRLPAVSSGLALCRAWSELGLAGAASCASLAASGIELVGVALAGTLAAATPAGPARRSGR